MNTCEEDWLQIHFGENKKQSFISVNIFSVCQDREMSRNVSDGQTGEDINSEREETTEHLKVTQGNEGKAKKTKMGFNQPVEEVAMDTASPHTRLEDGNIPAG